MARSPTKRTLDRLRSRGYRVGVVEKWVPQAGRRIDLFGVIDVLAIGNGETVAVQATSGANFASRVAKLRESDALADMRGSGWRVLVHGWRKNARNRWVCKEIEL